MHKTWVKFLEDVTEASKKHGPEPFFRGQTERNWPLLPSLGRRKYHDLTENVLYYDFLTHSASLVSTATDSWDLLFIMRHHGLPTRLLDWTQSFAVALYFAMAGKPSSPTIFVLDAYELNRATISENTVWHPQTDFEGTYFDYFISEKPSRFPGPVISILANRNTPRVMAQRSVFTIHKDLQRSVDSIAPDAITKIELPKAAIPDAKQFMQMAGITPFSLFPDLDGLAAWLTEEHELNFFPLVTTEEAKTAGSSASVLGSKSSKR